MEGEKQRCSQLSRSVRERQCSHKGMRGPVLPATRGTDSPVPFLSEMFWNLGWDIFPLPHKEFSRKLIMKPDAGLNWLKPRGRAVFFRGSLGGSHECTFRGSEEQSCPMERKNPKVS